MPYIDQESRKRLEDGDWPETPGELNYLITRIVDHYLARKGLRYAMLNEVVGVLACAQLELYRRVAAPLEDSKRALNGDVYRAKP